MAGQQGDAEFGCAELILQNVSANMANQSCSNENEAIIKAMPALLETDFFLASFYISIMSVALFIGTFGNIMILLVAGLARGIHKIGKEFMVNLALADLCVSAIADPMCILGVVKGEHFFNGTSWLCYTVASLCLTACFCAFASLTMLSLNRYVYLCHNSVYDRIYGRKRCILMCIFCWVFAFVCEFPNFIGWGGHYFDQKSHQCIWDRTSSISYTLFVAFGLIGFPLLTMAVCFVLIFRRIWNTKKALYEIDTTKDARVGKIMTETARTAKNIFVIFMVFVVCWTPYAIVIAIDIEDKLPMSVHLFITLLAHLHSSANFTIFFIGNKRFRLALARILGCAKTSKSTTSTSDTKVSTVDASFDQIKHYEKTSKFPDYDDINRKCSSSSSTSSVEGLKNRDSKYM